MNLYLGHHPTLVSYDTNSTILTALHLLVNASKSVPSLRRNPEFAFDITDLTRQLLANQFINLYVNLISIWNASSTSPQDVSRAGSPLIDLLTDLDKLLYTNENYLLSTWIRDAKAWGKGNTSYEDYLEYNARNQITLWGPTGEINDYASKQWAGLVGEYYAKRWKAFVEILLGQKASGEVYNSSKTSEKMLGIGEMWGLKRWGEGEGEVWGTKGTTWEVVDDILEKWT